MAGLNFMGLGFSFGAEDKGLSRMQRDVDSGFLKITGTLEQLATVASKFSTTGMNLTTGLEASRTAWDKSVRSTLVGAGIMGEELKKARREAMGLAEGLNISGTAAAESVVAFKRSSDVFKAMKVDAKELAKFQEAFGVKSLELADITKRLTGEMKLAPDAAADLMGKIIDSGQATEDVAGQFSFFKDNIDLISRASAAGFTDTKKFAEGMLSTSKALFKMGLDSKTARASTVSLSEAMIDSQEAMHGLRSGTNKDIGPLLKEMSIVRQDLGSAFDTMKEGPEGFTKGMGQVFAQMVKFKKGNVTEALDFFSARMSKVLDPKTAASFKNVFKNMAASGEQFDPNTFGDKFALVAKSMKDMNKEGFRTGRTTEQWMKLYEEQFVVKFRNITGAGNELMHENGKALRKYGGLLKGMAKADGPVGSFMTKMSEMHSIGASALLPKSMRGVAHTMGLMIEQTVPLIKNLEDLGFTSLSLTSGFKGTGLAMAGTAFMIAAEEEKIRQALKKSGKSTQDVAAIHEEALKRTSAAISGWVDEGLKSIGSFIDGLPQLFSDMDRIFRDTQRVLGPAIGKVFDTVIKIFLDAWDGVVKGWEGKAIDPLSSATTKVIQGWVIDLKAAVKKKWGEFKTFITDAWVGVVRAWEGKSISVFTSPTTRTVQKWTAFLIEKVTAAWNGFKTFLGNTWRGVLMAWEGEAATAADPLSTQVSNKIYTALDAAFTEMWPKFKTFLKETWDGVLLGWSEGFSPNATDSPTYVTAWKISSSLREFIVPAMGAVGDFLDETWKGLLKGWANDSAVPGDSAADKIGVALGKALSKAAESALDVFWDVLWAGTKALFVKLAKFMGTAALVVTSPSTAIGMALGKLGLEKILNRDKATVPNPVKAPATTSSGSFDMMKGIDMSGAFDGQGPRRSAQPIAPRTVKPPSLRSQREAMKEANKPLVKGSEAQVQALLDISGKLDEQNKMFSAFFAAGGLQAATVTSESAAASKRTVAPKVHRGQVAKNGVPHRVGET